MYEHRLDRDADGGLRAAALLGEPIEHRLVGGDPGPTLDAQDLLVTGKDEHQHGAAAMRSRARLVADVSARFARARAEHPEFAGATVAIGGPSDGIYAAFASQDSLLIDLGLEVSAELDRPRAGGHRLRRLPPHPQR